MHAARILFAFFTVFLLPIFAAPLPFHLTVRTVHGGSEISAAGQHPILLARRPGGVVGSLVNAAHDLKSGVKTAPTVKAPDAKPVASQVKSVAKTAGSVANHASTAAMVGSSVSPHTDAQNQPKPHESTSEKIKDGFKKFGQDVKKGFEKVGEGLKKGYEAVKGFVGDVAHDMSDGCMGKVSGTKGQKIEQGFAKAACAVGEAVKIAPKRRSNRAGGL